MLLYAPSRGEDDKISNGYTWLGAGTCQHSEDGGILDEQMAATQTGARRSLMTYTVVKRDGIDDHKVDKVILVGIIVTMPSDDIKWRVILCCQHRAL